MKAFTVPKAIGRVLAAIWVLALAFYVLAGTALAPFHGDESTLVFMSRDYAYQFIQRDYSQLAYSSTPTSPTEQELRLLNGTVPKLLIGLSWHLGGYSITDLNEQWDWGASWDYNQQNGHAPSEAILLLARLPSVLLLAAGVPLMFALGWAGGGGWAAYAASLYYALSPGLLLNGRRGMMEGSLMFFGLLLVLAGVWLLQRPSLARALLVGLAAGFALASKHSALFTVGAIFGAALLRLVIQSLRGRDDFSEVDYTIFPYLAIAAVLAAGVFYLLNPAWWGAPLDRLQTVAGLRQNLLKIQTDVFGSYPDFGAKLEGFWRQVFIAQPQYFEVAGWDAYISDPIIRYEASGWSGVSVGGSPVGAFVLCGMIALGGWGLWRGVGSTQGGARWALGVWALAMLGAVALVTPLEWQRYYLPAYPAVGVLAGVGVAWAVNRISAAWRSRRPA